ncbi:MAG: flagellar basal body-associated FliL family protein [Pseudomonadota bacterium]
MGKLVPLILAIVGLGAGAGAGIMLRPPAEPAELTEPEVPLVPPDYVKMSNQFVIPVVEGGQVTAMVVLSLNLEVTAGSSEAVYAREPKLRDAFLQVLFDHANAGGFRGAFTDAANLVLLREALTETASKAVPDLITDVLIVEIVRQDS